MPRSRAIVTLNVVTAGYSGTPLAKKLGVKEGHRVTLIDAPHDWAIGDLPSSVRLLRRSGTTTSDVVIAFINDAASLDREIESLANTITPDGSLWIAWPAKLRVIARTSLTTSFEIRYCLSSRRREGRGVRRRLVSPQDGVAQGVTRDTPVTTSALTDVGPLWPLGAVRATRTRIPRLQRLRDVGRCREFSVVLDGRRIDDGYLSDRLCGRRRCRCVTLLLERVVVVDVLCGGARTLTSEPVSTVTSAPVVVRPSAITAGPSIVWRTACAAANDVAELLA